MTIDPLVDDLDVMRNLLSAIIVLKLEGSRADLLMSLVQHAFAAGQLRGFDAATSLAKLRDEAERMTRRVADLNLMEPQGRA